MSNGHSPSRPPLDNYAAHKHPRVHQWLARHERFTFHFTPTSCSSRNAAEGFFAKLTKQRLKRGALRSVADLQAAIKRFLNEHNGASKPSPGPPIQTKLLPAVRRAPSVRFDPPAPFRVGQSDPEAASDSLNTWSRSEKRSARVSVFIKGLFRSTADWLAAAHWRAAVAFA